MRTAITFIRKVIQTVIHSSNKIASYVYLRNRIYYFQLRLPRYDARHHEFKSGLIRKSLKTSNYREAVNKARLLWFENMVNKKASTTQDDIEKVAQYDAEAFYIMVINKSKITTQWLQMPKFLDKISITKLVFLFKNRYVNSYDEQKLSLLAQA